MPALVTLAVGPCVVLLHAIYVSDRYEKEPIRSLVRYLLVGAGGGVLAWAIESLLGAALPLSHWLKWGAI